MKRKRQLLCGVLCFGLVIALGLVGCGGDGDGDGGGDGSSCGSACSKAFSCLQEWGVDPSYLGGSVDACTTACKAETNPILKCALNCNAGASCTDYGNCINSCAPTGN